MKRTEIKEALQMQELDKEINVKGWVRNKRGSKNVAFIALNDGSTINNLQLVIDLNVIPEEPAVAKGANAHIQILIDLVAEGIDELQLLFVIHAFIGVDIVQAVFIISVCVVPNTVCDQVVDDALCVLGAGYNAGTVNLTGHQTGGILGAVRHRNNIPFEGGAGKRIGSKVVSSVNEHAHITGLEGLIL